MKIFSRNSHGRIICLACVFIVISASELLAQFSIPYVPSIPIRPRTVAPRPTAPQTTMPTATPSSTTSSTTTAQSPAMNPYVLISQSLSEKYQAGFIQTMNKNLLGSSSAQRLEMIRVLGLARKSALAGKTEDAGKEFVEFIKVLAPGQPAEAYDQIAATFGKLTAKQMAAHLGQYSLQIEAVSRAIAARESQGLPPLELPSDPRSFEPEIIRDTIPEDRNLPTEPFQSNGISFYIPPFLEFMFPTNVEPVKEKPADADKYWVVIYDASHPKGGSKAPAITSYRDDIATLYKQLIEAGVLESQILLLDEKTGASKDRFLAKLKDTVAKLQPDSHLFVYCQGYAIHLEGTDYLVPDDYSAADIERAIKNRGTPVPLPSLMSLQSVLNILGTSKCYAHGLFINAHSAHPADIANVSVAASYPVIPFGSQKSLSIPDQTVMVISRSLQNLPRNAGILGVRLARMLPKTTVFLRIVIESFSGFARGDGEEEASEEESSETSDKVVTTRHMIEFLQHRSQLENYREPLIRSNITTEFALLPHFETPSIISEIDRTLVAQIQEDMYIAGCRVLMEGHRSGEASSLFGGCNSVDPTSETAKKAQMAQNLAMISAGDVRRAFQETTRPRKRVFAYVWDREGANIYKDKTGDETATIEREETTYETRTVRSRWGRPVQQRVPKTQKVTVPAKFEPGTAIIIDRFCEYPTGHFRCHVAKILESGDDADTPMVEIVPMETDTEDEDVGWIEASALNVDDFGKEMREDLSRKMDEFTLMIYKRHSQRPKRPKPNE